MSLRNAALVGLAAVIVAARAGAAPAGGAVPARQFRHDFEDPAQRAAWTGWSNLHQVRIDLASPGCGSPTCLRFTVPASDWDTAIIEFSTPIRVTDRTMLRFKMKTAGGSLEGVNVRDATEGAEYLLSFPLPTSAWITVQQYLRSALYKRFGKPGAVHDGLVGDEVSSLQVAYSGTELCLDDVEIFEAAGKLPELPAEALLPAGSYQPRSFACLREVFPFGVISTVAAGDAANAALFGQSSDERFEADLLDLKRHGMNAVSNFCDDGRVAWRLGLMDKYGLYLVETALANADLREPDKSVGRTGSDRGAGRAGAGKSPAQALVEASRNHPRLLAWYGRDEPQDCLAYLKNKRILNSYDPGHPVASALNRPQVARLLGPYMELMMLDPYTVFLPQRTIDQLAFHADLVRNARCYCQGRSVWLIPQAFSWRSGKTTSMRMPDPAEARFDVFNALGAGASGFLFFIYNDTCTYLDGKLRGEEFDDTLVDPWGNAHPTYEALAELARPLTAAMPALLGATDPGEQKPAVQYPQDRLVLGQLHSEAGEALILTSRDLATRCRAQVKVGLRPGQRLYDLLAVRELTPEGDGSFGLDLQAGGGAVLLATEPRRWETVRAGIRARARREECEELRVECMVARRRGLDTGRAEQLLRQAEAPATPRPSLRAVREELAAREAADAGYAAMKRGLADAQGRFGAIHRLIRPLVATVDGTTDACWVERLGRLRTLSATYFALRRQFEQGDRSGAARVPGLVAEVEALRAEVEATIGH